MPEAFQRKMTGGGTAYVERGSGEALVFIHGVGLNADVWSPQIAEFASTHRVIAVDMLGHGQSILPAEDAILDNYVMQILRLLDDLKIAKANIVGHSMGGLVALGFALAYPERTSRIAGLSSVYERTPDQRASVEARAREIDSSGTVGDIEQPLQRWFGDDHAALKNVTRQWLCDVNPRGYATAYKIFATGDRDFSGCLGSLNAPALFATGSLDPNSTPAMSLSMAAGAPRGKALILDGQRHMMTLVDPRRTNEALRALLAEPLQIFDPRELRGAFGSFMTGVTIVTTIDGNGHPRGFTANSFTSVSLDPPLLLVCIGKNAASCETFSKAPSFAVNVLSEQQKIASGIFASKRPDKFADVAWHSAKSGNPLIDGSAAWFDCARHDIIDAGDHIILLGAVRDFAHSDANPLGYARGGYLTLGLEQAAVNAASGGRTVVGAILESAGKLVLARDPPTATLRLPDVGRNGPSGSASLLCDDLRRGGIDVNLGFLFAVFENPQTKVQSIYYRGDASVRDGSRYEFADFDDIPWDRFPDEATRAMLRRYADERLQGRFKIYSGSHEEGEIKTLD